MKVAKVGIIVIIVTCATGSLPQVGRAQNTSGDITLEQLARQLDETRQTLRQTQDELQVLRERDAQRQQWEESVIRRLPPPGVTFSEASYGGGENLYEGTGVCGPADGCCPDCGKSVCPGLPHLCAVCLDSLSWNKDNCWRIVPYGTLRGEAIYTSAYTTADWGIIFVNPANIGVNPDQFTVHGKTSILGFEFQGPCFGNWKTGGNVMMNFTGSQPLRNTSGPNVLNAYGEVYNDNWRFAFGRMWDLFSPISPSTVNMILQRGAGNIGLYRGALQLDRYVTPGDYSQWTISTRISQQVINDYLTIPQVTGTDAGWPNVEARIGVALGEKGVDGRPFEIGVSGLIGQTRAVVTEILDDLIPVTGAAVSTTWGVCLDAQLKGKRIGARGEVWAGQAAGTYFMATLQSLNPETDRAIRSVGGWGEIYFKPTDCVKFHVGYGVDDPRSQDLGFFSPALSAPGQITLNQVAWGNIKYNVTDYFELGFEISYRETLYLNPFADNSGMLYHFSSTLSY